MFQLIIESNKFLRLYGLYLVSLPQLFQIFIEQNIYGNCYIQKRTD